MKRAYNQYVLGTILSATLLLPGVAALADDVPAAQAPTAPVAPTYVVQPDDVLDISVVGEPELSKTVTVLADGKISYPYVGEMVVSGLTLKDVQKRITAKVARELQGPEVVVSLSRRADKSASVLGAVKTTGKVILQKDWRVLDLLAASGGLTTARPEWASAVLVHANGESVPVDLLRLIAFADARDNVLVAPGDILLVREVEQAKTQVQVLGEVAKPGALPVPSDGSIAAVLASVGGPTPAAALTKANILRGSETIPVNLQSLMNEGKSIAGVTLQPGDTLVVPANRQTVAVFGAVTRPGVVTYPEDKQLDFLSTLSLAGGQSNDADLKKAVLLRPSPTGGKPTLTEVNLWNAMSKGDLSQNVAVQPGDVLFVPGKNSNNRLNSRDLLSLANPLVFLFR